jgi:hypothetical protein
VQVCRKAAAESVPAVPLGQGIVPFEEMAVGFVLILPFAADFAAGKGRNDYARTRLSRFNGCPFPA